MSQGDIAISKNSRLWLIAALGVALGILGVFSPGAICDLILFFAGIYMIRSLNTREEGSFLVRLFIYGIALRVILLLLIQFVLIYKGRWFQGFEDKAVFLFGDDGYYTIRSWWMTQHISGVHIGLDKFYNAFMDYAYSFHLYLLAFFYYLFGFSPVSVVFLNCLIGVTTGTVYYFAAKEITDERSAKIVAVMTVFFPSLMIWSISNLKDPLFIFFIGLVLLAFIRFTKYSNLKYVVLFIIALAALLLIRPRFNLFIEVIALWGVVSYLLINRKVRFWHILIVLLIILMAWPVIYPGFQVQKRALVAYHWGAVAKGHCYHIYGDWFYAHNSNVNRITDMEFLKSALKGTAHFFAEPFPWKMDSLLELAALPQVILWYLILALSILGAFLQLKRNTGIAAALLIFLLLIGAIFGLTSGNIGTVFRMRDMLTPLIMVFAAVGIRSVLR